jgi:hypothetical protein
MARRGLSVGTGPLSRRSSVGRRSGGIPKLERVTAVLNNPAIYELAELIPRVELGRGGRRRQYPEYLWLIYEALISVYRSARQVEAELSHPAVWGLLRDVMRRRFPRDPSQWLPAAPMRRHHYLYARNRYLSDPEVLAALTRLHRELAAGQAQELGLLDPDGPGSWTHPDLSRMLHADGKVVTPLFRAKPDDERVDRRTGEIRPARHDPDAGLHVEGDGEIAWGTKFVLVAARTTDPHGRIILDVDWVPRPGGEARTAMDSFARLAPLVPGAHGVIYDTALRGVHHQRLLRELGLLPINRVAAAKANPKTARRAERRIEKSAYIEDKTVTINGQHRTVTLYARGGAVGLGQLTETGDLTFTELPRIRTHRTQDKNGQYRWYNDYRLPDRYDAQTITLRLHANSQDATRKFNRTENVRPIPPTDPDFARLYPRRNDSESINRNLEDTFWLGRAHSVGHARQHLNLLGYALMVNGLALHRHQRQRNQLAA